MDLGQSTGGNLPSPKLQPQAKPYIPPSIFRRTLHWKIKLQQLIQVLVETCGKGPVKTPSSNSPEPHFLKGHTRQTQRPRGIGNWWGNECQSRKKCEGENTGIKHLLHIFSFASFPFRIQELGEQQKFQWDTSRHWLPMCCLRQLFQLMSLMSQSEQYYIQLQ